MKPTLKYLQDRFSYYNDLCFEGKLPTIPIRLCDRKGFMGRTRCQVNRFTGKDSFLIEISIRFDLPEEEYIDTLVHEMIHYYIMVNHIPDDAMHGRMFTSIMNQIAERHRIRVTIAYNPDPEHMPVGRLRWHFVCVLEFGDGRTAFSVVARNKVIELWRFWQQQPDVKSTEWYLSCDPLFDNVPISVSPRATIFDRSTLLRHLANADLLVQEGNTIRPES